MKIEKHKLKKKEDLAIFKLFLRCMKEHGLYKNFRGYKDMIDRCYYSRTSHKGETFLENIGYWPIDTSSGISRPEIKILYMSLVINSLPMEMFSTKDCNGIIEGLKLIFKNYTICSSNLEIKDEYLDIVSSALSKCFNFIDKEEMKGIIDLIKKGRKIGIPF